VSVDVQFTYPPTYPEVVPEFSVVSHSGLLEEQIGEIEARLSSVVSGFVSTTSYHSIVITFFELLLFPRLRRILEW